MLDSPKLVALAKRLLANLASRDLSPSTQKIYAKTAARYYERPDDVLNTTSKRTYYLRKAALNWWATQVLGEAISHEIIDNACLARIDQALRILQRFGPELKRGESLRLGKRCPINSTPRVSKRRSLKGLPIDWREQVIGKLTGYHRDWAWLMAICGCRPSEIALGINVRPDGDGVTITIRGTKTDRGHGQPKRVLHVSGNLVDVGQIGCERTIKSVSANAVSTALGRAGRAVFGSKRARLVSAYSFRHQVASDLKASGMPAEEASAFLGHASAETKRYYGSPLQSRGNLRFDLRSAERKVSVVQRAPRGKRCDCRQARAE